MEITAEQLRLIREKFETNHFPRSLGIELDSIEHGRARLSLEVRQQHLQLAGIMHGGAIATLIDTAVAFAIVGASKPGSRFTTIEMKVNYLRPIREGRVVADAKLIRDGRRIVVSDCDVYDAEGKLSAKGLLTYMRLDENNE
ncbi:MAG TPA: PaaI family thioesterase [Blastocatellia bacterium]|nr:PaaI family thioesterase [Blastocatellia bacterium]